MPSMLLNPENHPYRSLISIFILVRIIYFTIALLTPSPAYDSSTNLILPQRDENGSVLWTLLAKLSERLTRWDAIYFVKIAERGYVNEQEWAFGWGFTRLMGVVGRGIIKISPAHIPSPYPFIFSGLLIANGSHLGSALVLYKLTEFVFPFARAPFPFVASLLHIISPAGLFLAAPYSESLFSLLTFTGYLIYASSSTARSFQRNLGIVAAGAVFSLSTLVRSNGVLNGLILLKSFIEEIWMMFQQIQRAEFIERVGRIISLGIAGLMVGAGLAIPQSIAWVEYCTIERETREWCTRIPPSIYLWVQERYWNVGFLRYWTISNIPLFLLAAPMLCILLKSGTAAVTVNIHEPPPVAAVASNGDKHPKPNPQTPTVLIKEFAIPQVALACLALVSYHVQIINRLSSGCVVWYWWLAQAITNEAQGSAPVGERKVGLWVVRWMVVYGLVQAVLFAGFLPPA
ncbi:GPI mannosyltransferase 2 [Kalaharituber pfeilii]|nr:GPI mannosyltransferase 2 [Kalaharituber pfeilii]